MDPGLEVPSQQTFEGWERASQLMARGDVEWEALVRDEEEELPVVVISPEFLLSAIVALLQRPEWARCMPTPRRPFSSRRLWLNASICLRQRWINCGGPWPSAQMDCRGLTRNVLPRDWFATRPCAAGVTIACS